MTDYVKKLGLSHDPFKATARYRSFFAGADREGLLQRLIEQAHYGAPISIVCGALGMGKSTLAREFQRSFSEEALCIHVQATLFMNQGQFLDALLEQLPVGASTPEVEDILQDLGQFAERLYLDAKTLVLIVDDAHELGSDVLEMIASMTSSATEGAIHVLLLGEKQLGNMLGNILGEQAFGRMLEEELLPMTADDACAYVRLKLADAGFSGDIPVETAEIGAMNNETQGVPGSFNIHMADALAASLKKKVKRIGQQGQMESILELGAPYWATAGVLVVLLIALLTLTSPRSAAPDSVAGTEVPGTTRIDLPLTVTRDDQLADDSVVADVIAAEPVQQEPDTANSVVAVEEAPHLQARVSRLDGEESGGSESAPPLADVATPVDRSIEELPGDSLLSYPAENYTVQVMGSRSEDNVRKFINQQLAAFNGQYFETRHQDRPWFVVVTGNFVSRDVAARAIADLPASIRRMDPFIRQLGDVQKDIRQYQD